MLSTSYAFKKRLQENSATLAKAALALSDGTVETLDGGDFVLGGVRVTKASSTMGNFDVGAAIVGTCDVTLANYDGRFDQYDFTGATLAVSVGVQLESGVEWLLMGTYGIEQPDSYGSTIGLHCLDNMRLLNVPYSEVPTTYPATLQTIVRQACATCGITMASASFDNDDYVVPSAPDYPNLTCLQVISYAAQIAGCFVDCDPDGLLRVRWYDTTALEGEDWLDGGTYDTETTPYSDGDAADGGWFMDGGTTKDGGQFTAGRYAVVSAISSLTVGTDDVVITGVRVTAQDGEDGDGEPVDGETDLRGTDDYLISVDDNPLVRFGQASAVAALIAPRVVGMRFRAFSVSAIGDPSIEAGDPCVIVDAQQRIYHSYATLVTYKVGGYETMSCDAQPPARNSAQPRSSLTRSVVRTRRELGNERTTREREMEELSRRLANSSGLYMTTAPQQDGSNIYYAHDKPTLAESLIIWKFQAEGISISTNGGRDYPWLLDAGGTAVLNRIYAIGINADYITTGRVESEDGTTYIDFETKDIVLAGKTAQQVADATASVRSVAVQYAQSTSRTQAPADSSPIWTDAPGTLSAGHYLWTRLAVRTPNGTAYSSHSCIDSVGAISAVTEWYLSTSSVSPLNGSWSETQPKWTKGHYVWTRTHLTMADGSALYTGTALADVTNALAELAHGQNIAPFFNAPLDAAAVWDATTDSTHVTVMAGGWAHVACDNTSGGSAVYVQVRQLLDAVPELRPTRRYTIMAEVDACTTSGDVWLYALATNSQSALSSNCRTQLANVSDYGTTHRSTVTAISSFSSSVRYATSGYVLVPAGASVEMDLRLSLYADEYEGDYSPYSATWGTSENASKTATNFVEIDANGGITVGNLVNSTLGANVYIASDGVYNRVGTTVLSSFTATGMTVYVNGNPSVQVLSTGMKVYSGTNLTLEVTSSNIYMKPGNGQSGWVSVSGSGMYWYNGTKIKASLDMVSSTPSLDLSTVNLMAWSNGGRIWAYKGLSLIAAVDGMNPSAGTHSMSVGAHSPAIYMEPSSDTSTTDGTVTIRPGNASANILKVGPDGVNVGDLVVTRGTGGATMVTSSKSLYLVGAHVYAKSTATGNTQMII